MELPRPKRPRFLSAEEEERTDDVIDTGCGCTCGCLFLSVFGGAAFVIVCWCLRTGLDLLHHF